MSDDAWEKFKRRGEAIDRTNREHLESLTLEQAIQDVEDLLSHPLLPDRAPLPAPLPVSLARRIAMNARP